MTFIDDGRDTAYNRRERLIRKHMTLFASDMTTMPSVWQRIARDRAITAIRQGYGGGEKFIQAATQDW